MKKPTVTIGIPVFNEEKRISYLLNSIFAQYQKAYKIEHIYVCSDGSTDNTDKVVAGFKDPRITFIRNKKRRGVTVRQNQIMEKTTSDVLILLDADIVLMGENCLRELIHPIVEKKADLTSSDLMAVPPKTLIEKALYMGLVMKNAIFNAYKKGKNLYTCHGSARAFSKRFYTQFRFKDSIAEEAYSYLYCVFHNFKYVCVRRAKIMIKLPDHFIEYQKESIKFMHSMHRFEKEFGKDFIEQQYYLPLGLKLKKTTYASLESPFYAVVYMSILLFSRIQQRFISPQVWRLSKSSTSFQI